MTTHSLLRSRLTPPGAVETDAAPDPANHRGSVEIALRGDGTAGYPLPGVFDQAVEELHDLERMIARKWEAEFPDEDLPTPKRALLRLFWGVRVTEVYRRDRQNVMNQMKERLANGLDPLTGDPMVTVGKIRNVGGKCFDETDREVRLDEKGNWVYA